MCVRITLHLLFQASVTPRWPRARAAGESGWWWRRVGRRVCVGRHPASHPYRSYMSEASIQSQELTSVSSFWRMASASSVWTWPSGGCCAVRPSGHGTQSTGTGTARWQNLCNFQLSIFHFRGPIYPCRLVWFLTRQHHRTQSGLTAGKSKVLSKFKIKDCQ